MRIGGGGGSIVRVEIWGWRYGGGEGGREGRGGWGDGP